MCGSSRTCVQARSSRTARAPGGEYVLAVRRLEPRKNLPRVLLAASVRGWTCESSAEPAGVMSTSSLVASSPTTSRPVSTAVRPALCIRRCTRAFGLPVLEAIASGTPVGDERERRASGAVGGTAVLVDPSTSRRSLRGIEEARAAPVGREWPGWLGRSRSHGKPRRPGDGRGLLRGGGVIDVLLDANVVGRQRTGDETYAENLLRALPAAAPDLRFAAVTRNPSRVPEGVEALDLPRGSQEFRMPWRLPRLLRRVWPRGAETARATSSSSAPSSGARTRGRHSRQRRSCGCRWFVLGPEKEASLAREPRRLGGDLRGYVQNDELAGLHRDAGCLVVSVAVRVFRSPGARGDGKWDACRRRPRPGTAGGGGRGGGVCRPGRPAGRDPPRPGSPLRVTRSRAPTSVAVQPDRSSTRHRRCLPEAAVSVTPASSWSTSQRRSSSAASRTATAGR